MRHLATLVAYDGSVILQIDSEHKLLIDADQQGNGKLVGQIDVLIGDEVVNLYIGKSMASLGYITVEQTTYQEN